MPPHSSLSVFFLGFPCCLRLGLPASRLPRVRGLSILCLSIHPHAAVSRSPDLPPSPDPPLSPPGYTPALEVVARASNVTSHLSLTTALPPCHWSWRLHSHFVPAKSSERHRWLPFQPSYLHAATTCPSLSSWSSPWEVQQLGYGHTAQQLPHRANCLTTCAVSSPARWGARTQRI